MLFAKSSRDKVTFSQAKNVSPLRKKPKLPYAEKTQVGYVPSSSAKSKDEDRSGMSAHDPVVESRAAKRGVDSASLTPLEERLAEAKKTRKSSARAKGSSASAVDPKMNKSSPARDTYVSDLLKTTFYQTCPAVLSWSIISVRLTILAPSRVFPWKNELGYLDGSTGNDPLYAIGDGDIEMLCSDLLLMQSEPVNVVNTEGAEEQAVEEAVAEEDEAEKDAADEVVTDIADQAGGAAENVADPADAEEAVDQGSPTSISE
ncbi:unnamed protein product [Prunus armeniaca]